MSGVKKFGKFGIAAHALETGSVLATYDAHFRAVPGLRLGTR